MRSTSLGTLACLTLGGLLGGAAPLDVVLPAPGEATAAEGTGSIIRIGLRGDAAFVKDDLPDIDAAAGMTSAFTPVTASGSGIVRQSATPERPVVEAAPVWIAEAPSLEMAAADIFDDGAGKGRAAGPLRPSHDQQAAQTGEPLPAPPRSEYQALMGGRDTNLFDALPPALLREIGERIGRDDFSGDVASAERADAPASHTPPGRPVRAAASETVRPALAALPPSSEPLAVAAIAQATSSPPLPANDGSSAYIDQIGSRPASAYMGQIDPTVQQGRLAVRYGDRALATVAFQIVPGAGMSVHSGQLLDLFRDGMDAPTFARLRNSAASDSFVSLDRLAAEGIPVRYDPVYDEIVVGDAG